MENKIVMEFPQENDTDLYLNVFGHSITEPLHKAGPAVKTFYLIHFVLEGEGDFYVKGAHYHLKKGQGFLIEPDTPATYISDEHHPWRYVWFGFSGRCAHDTLSSIGLTQNQPIFTCEDGDKLKKYVFVIANAQKDKLETPSGNAYVNHAISYIQNHYSMPMKVEELSDYVGINRSYFSDLFKQYTGMSPVKYLQNFRITKAQHMLTISELSVESIAFSCGYQSAEAFHKIFRKTTGMSPNAYRQEKRQRTLSSQETVNNNRPDYIVTDDEL